MNQKTIIMLIVGVIIAVSIGIWTLFFTPGSTTTSIQLNRGPYASQSLHYAPINPTEHLGSAYVPFDPKYGLQGVQRSVQKQRQGK